jgi:ABC-type molybdenum transport system ATPase subunit/photorepair protein PhrA
MDPMARLTKLGTQITKAAAVRDNLQLRCEGLALDLANYENDVGVYAKCSEIFKSILEEAVEANINSIADLVTTGLKFIINDQELVFKIRQEHKNNRISMKFSLIQDGVEGDPLSSFGGGAAVVISLILRIAIMQRMNMGNLLILDESMVALANAYVPDAAAFMKQLSEKTGIHILMVTHNPEFVTNSHTAYEGYKSDSLHLKRIEVVS